MAEASKMIKFPEGFYWGSSTSAPQSEGRLEGDGKGDNDWDYWYSISPERFHQQIGPKDTSTFYTHYQKDINLLVETGHSIFRTSIQWARLFPKGRGDINQKAVIFYRDVFRRIKDKGIVLMVNLYHFDLPFTLEKEGGWENKATVYAYRDYAKSCFELFGDLVDRWITFNEPIVPVECGYLYHFHYPDKEDARTAVQVAYNTQLASSLAVAVCHDVLPKKKIGIILNLTPAYPRSQSSEDVFAAHVAELFQAKSFLDPSTKGVYPKNLVAILKKHNLLPDYDKEELELISKHRVDYLGVNYYQPLRVQAPDTPYPKDKAFMPEYYYQNYDMPGRKINPYRGWEIYERGVYDIAKMIQKDYDNIEWFLTENGMGVEDEARFRKDGTIQDDYRIDFIKGHLRELHRAILEGSNCKGYLVWTFIDCWSWLNSYKNRYGLIELDLATQERHLKKSGYWFKALSQNNGFEEL